MNHRFHAAAWHLDPIVTCDEVFAQVRDAVLTNANASDAQRLRHVGDFDSLLAAFEFRLAGPSGFELRPAAVIRVNFFEMVLLPALTPWSRDGSWIAWSWDPMTTMVAQTCQAATLLFELPAWNQLRDEVACLGLPRMHAVAQVLDGYVSRTRPTKVEDHLASLA